MVNYMIDIQQQNVSCPCFIHKFFNIDVNFVVFKFITNEHEKTSMIIFMFVKMYSDGNVATIDVNFL
jgi:hypothetical protein